MSKESHSIAIVATLDSKGAEAEFVRRRLLERQQNALVIDIGTRGIPAFEPDYSREQIRQGFYNFLPEENLGREAWIKSLLSIKLYGWMNKFAI